MKLLACHLLQFALDMLSIKDPPSLELLVLFKETAHKHP
jgi:hypothetical protein